MQKWRLGNWPEGHFSTLTLNFDQDDGNGVTIMRVEWDAIPLGEEDSTQGRWEEYYVRSMKKTFGYVSFLLCRLIFMFSQQEYIADRIVRLGRFGTIL